MGRFHFHVYDEFTAADDYGLDMPSVGAAVQEALRGARDLAAAQVLAGRLNLNHRVEVADETGAVIATVTFRDAVAVEG